MIWLETGGYTLTVGLSLDPLSYLLALLVAGVGLTVSVYAVAYMAAEADKPRFFALFVFFIGAMLTLVLSNSFVLLFAAWEAVGTRFVRTHRVLVSAARRAAGGAKSVSGDALGRPRSPVGLAAHPSAHGHDRYPYGAGFARLP